MIVVQSNRIRQNLIATKNIEKAKAYILMTWDGKEIQVVEVTEIDDAVELERFVLATAAHGNDFLRRILKHRLELGGKYNGD